MVAALVGVLIGVSKAGFGGVGPLFVALMASIMGARTSTGFLLPLLIVGDILAVCAFRQHANWTYVRRLLPPAMIGVVVGFFAMRVLDEGVYKPVIGVTVLVLCVLQILRMTRESWFAHLPHSRALGIGMGSACGVTTMLSNGSGPIASWYFLVSGLPKMELVGTAAWFFLLINLWKVPFSIGLGLIHLDSLWFNLLLAPFVPLGILVGRWALYRISQTFFEWMLLAFALIAALRLLLF